eukprot:GAFH01005604.1.p5 GENE.GAFH01005604.1~~GAFH01005604.1.p5  ORF type:complete len:51 (+),score=5.93 GAFH01005604.1:99-251(+)
MGQAVPQDLRHHRRRGNLRRKRKRHKGHRAADGRAGLAGVEGEGVARVER